MPKNRQIVTLTTDWIDKSYYSSVIERDNMPKTFPIGDHYVAQLKGILRQISNNIEIIDISNTIQAFNTVQAGFILKNSYEFFPNGTIHIVGVNSEPSPKNKIVLIEKFNQYFIGTNDGMFSMIFDDDPDFIVELVPDESIRGFSALKLFAVTVNYIINGKKDIIPGKPCEMVKRTYPSATYDDNMIYGSVVFIDHYGNLITNISHDLFETVRKGRPFQIIFRSEEKAITKISSYYDDVAPNRYLAIFNSSNILELAMRNANLAQLENFDVLSSIRIEFSNDRLFF